MTGEDGVARLGDTWHGGAARALFEFDSTEPLARVDWLGSLDGQTPGVVAAVGALPAGRHRQPIPSSSG